MTGYHFKIGYNGASGVSEDDGWTALREAARKVCDDPKAIIAEARRIGAPENCERGCCPLDGYADNYADPFSDYGHPVVIIENAKEVMQMASTGSPIKYHVRRAFARLLIVEMHRRGVEVNLTVA